MTRGRALLGSLVFLVVAGCLGVYATDENGEDHFVANVPSGETPQAIFNEATRTWVGGTSKIAYTDNVAFTTINITGNTSYVSSFARAGNNHLWIGTSGGGVYLTYSLDYDEARAVFQQAIAADPTDPAAYRQLAALNWLNLLFRNGAVMVDDYLGEIQQNVKRPAPSPDLDVQFRAAIERARTLAEQRLRKRPCWASSSHWTSCCSTYFGKRC